ncbi:MAG: hypothetical protein Q9163_003980 [Psora crenata]
MSSKQLPSHGEGVTSGEYHDASRGAPLKGDTFESEGGEGGIPGDKDRKVQSKYKAPEGSGQPSAGGSEASSSLGSFVFNTVLDAVHDIGSGLKKQLVGGGESHSHTHAGAQCADGIHDNDRHRYGSFAPERTGNNVKWYVDGCSYMWAVSRALEQATETIWILGWWISPELYLRRPPSKNEQYRLDRLLQAAAQRGVKVNIVVYKEVTQALTRKYLSPTMPKYLQSLLPSHADPISKAVVGFGLAATFASVEYMEEENPLIAPPLTVSSSHTKHALENLHPNIAVFRHPDHLPDPQTLQSAFFSSLQNISLTAKEAASLPSDALKAIYGMHDEVILYWAHHEKLCLIDGKTAFMGGLDLCYGRWDINQHPIADCHPSNLEDIVFPGQDYNNARIMDFQDVAQWQNNKLDRKESSRMGWSDVSISLSGPVVEDLRAHFVERWNFIYDEKYEVRKDVRYMRLSFTQNAAGAVGYKVPGAPPSGSKPFTPQSQGSTSDRGQPSYLQSAPVSGDMEDNQEKTSSRGLGQGTQPTRPYDHHKQQLKEAVGGFKASIGHVKDQYLSGNQPHSRLQGELEDAGIACQIVRSCAKWSHGVPTEHSIANAYISVIENSQHFVYIENQFFITATSDKQKPVRNKVGAAIVERILRAARAGEKYKVIVVMPAIPAFAGDLRDDASLGTRAIMEFQYNSINRGGHSIMESVANAGYDPTEYIRFYNLRNYDRINVNQLLREAEQRSGVSYDDARKEYEQAVELPAEMSGGQVMAQANLQQYHRAAEQVRSATGLRSREWDTVSECYMLRGQDVREIPWENADYPEINAFVSEELYVHSKLLIADDRIVICGSANLNDRSQLGYHDSEIAIIIEDPSQIDSYMNGRPYRAARFAATLRRQIFRNHLGLLPAQDMGRPDQNFEAIGVPNVYDHGSREDQMVMDPLSDTFLHLWNTRAKTNTDVFGRVFHCVPHDDVRTWNDYDSYYRHFFIPEDTKREESRKGSKKSSTYTGGHVVAENFSPGEQGAREVKELLSTIKGTLVEMPLLFLINEDIAKEGFTLNAFTEEVYT